MRSTYKYICNILHCEIRRDQAMLIIGFLTLIATIASVAITALAA